MVALPPFKHTIEFAIPDISAKIRKSYLSHKTRPLEWRLTQLRKLYWGCDFLPLFMLTPRLNS
jgi:beta-apo-4'-carotenal oxygenase